MKKHTCKLLSTLLAVIIILSSFVFPVFADTAPVTGKFGDEVNFSFDEKTGTLTLTGKGETWSTSDVNGGVSDKEDPLAEYREKIKKLVIGEGITSVGVSAFRDCENLAQIVYPKTLTRLENYCFMNTGVTEAYIPEGVVYIGQQIFSDCLNLKSASIPSTANYIEGLTFERSPKLEKVDIKCVCPFIIGSGIFTQCVSLKEVTVPEGSKVFTLDENGEVYINTETGRTIYQYILSKKDATYRIADGVKEIHVDSFRGAPNLKAVYIPKSVVKIGGVAFSTNIITDIYYEGSEEDWKKMDIDSNLYDTYIGFANTVKSVTIHYNSTPEQMTYVITGDIDGDGSVKSSDARLTLRASVGLKGDKDINKNPLDFTDKKNREFRAADVDGDGKISAADARFILRASVGLETFY